MSFWKKIIDAIDAFVNKDTTRRTVTGTERKERKYPVAPYGACDVNFEYLRREGNSYYTTRKVPYCADRSFKTETVETVFEFAYKNKKPPFIKKVVGSSKLLTVNSITYSPKWAILSSSNRCWKFLHPELSGQR